METPIYIAGLPRSGTTLLHFLVGSHPRCIALGEVTGYLNHAERTMCSCGVYTDECLFWSGVKERSYDAVKARVAEYYGPDKIMVDASKTRSGLDRLGDAKVLYCIRDVRGWAVSQRMESVFGYLRWHRRNKREMNLDRDFLVVSYDELILRLQDSRQRLMSYLGLEANSDTDFTNVEHHAVHANRMKTDATKMTRIDYDHRWIAKTNPWPAALLPWVMDYCNKHVYGLVPNVYADKAASKKLVIPK